MPVWEGKPQTEGPENSRLRWGGWFCKVRSIPIFPHASEERKGAGCHVPRFRAGSRRTVSPIPSAFHQPPPPETDPRAPWQTPPPSGGSPPAPPLPPPPPPSRSRWGAPPARPPSPSPRPPPAASEWARVDPGSAGESRGSKRPIPGFQITTTKFEKCRRIFLCDCFFENPSGPLLGFKSSVCRTPSAPGAWPRRLPPLCGSGPRHPPRAQASPPPHPRTLIPPSEPSLPWTPRPPPRM